MCGVSQRGLDSGKLSLRVWVNCSIPLGKISFGVGQMYGEQPFTNDGTNAAVETAIRHAFSTRIDPLSFPLPSRPFAEISG